MDWENQYFISHMYVTLQFSANYFSKRSSKINKSIMTIKSSVDNMV